MYFKSKCSKTFLCFMGFFLHFIITVCTLLVPVLFFFLLRAPDEIFLHHSFFSRLSAHFCQLFLFCEFLLCNCLSVFILSLSQLFYQCSTIFIHINCCCVVLLFFFIFLQLFFLFFSIYFLPKKFLVWRRSFPVSCCTTFSSNTNFFCSFLQQHYGHCAH